MGKELQRKFLILLNSHMNTKDTLTNNYSQQQHTLDKQDIQSPIYTTHYIKFLSLHRPIDNIGLKIFNLVVPFHQPIIFINILVHDFKVTFFVHPIRCMKRYVQVSFLQLFTLCNCYNHTMDTTIGQLENNQRF